MNPLYEWEDRMFSLLIAKVAINKLRSASHVLCCIEGPHTRHYTGPLISEPCLAMLRFFFKLAFFDETEARNPQTTFCRHPLWFLNFTVHWPRQSLKKPKHDWGKLGPKPDWIFNNSPTLDDGWPESVEEQGLLLLVWRHHITKQYIKDVL